MRITKALFLLTLPAILAGCPSTGVGDPCTPESTPMGGFQAAEAYLETSSVQCRTRVCMVYRLAGDPTQSKEDCLLEGLAPAVCDAFPARTELDERVFCTCRCDTGVPGDDTPVCECGEGFECTEILEQGGVGIRGSYCVRNEALDG